MNKLKLFLSVTFLSLTSLMFAQSMNEAGEALNNGIGALKAKDYVAAIKAFDNCITICDQLGDEGADLKMTAETQLPNAYYNKALNLYRAKKFDEAINTFQKTSELASGLNDAKTAGKAKNYIARVYNTKGSAQYKAKDYDNALASFDNALNADGTYFKAYYSKGLVYNKQKNTEAFKAAMDKVIELGPEGNKTVKAAKTTVFRSFRSAAGKALQAGNYSKSIENVETALTYSGGDAQIFYFATIANNGLKKWQKAIDSGNKAVELEKKSKSNIYFELGKAYEGMSNKAEACKSYKKVTDGPNLAAAKHKVTEELKCN
jgi:tetratricopeptide (TPR) repeat protein